MAVKNVIGNEISNAVGTGCLSAWSRQDGKHFSGKKERKKLGVCLFFLLLSLALCSCGAGEAALDLEEEQLVPVAEFLDMRMPVPLERIRSYAYSENWFYAAGSRHVGEKQTVCWSVYRGRIADEFEAEEYVAREGKALLVLLADREDNCYLFMRGEDGDFFLEKYDAGGELLWHTDCGAAQLAGREERLTEGIVTGDGRVALCACGEGGIAAVFGADGSLQGVYTPQLDSLEGIAEGQEGRIYGYCVTGEEPVFVDMEDTKERFVCPMMPLGVYGGSEDGIYLCTGEGLWRYSPRVGETERLWLWEDEYVQIESSQISLIFRGKESVNLICQRSELQNLQGLPWKGGTLSFVSVGFGKRKDYPGKQTVTISRSFYQNYEEYSRHRMEELVRRYNRQSHKYRVEILLPDEDMIQGNSRHELFEELEMQLIRGEGPDLIEVQALNMDRLAAKGALEDLTHYYEESEVVRSGEILEAVREAGRVAGRDMMVIPAFDLDSMLSREEVAADDWTPLRFLEMVEGDGRRIFSSPGRWAAFQYCMGVNLGGYFVDYEKRECYFDREEFRRILEECKDWETEPPVVAHSIEELEAQAQNFIEPEWLLKPIGISNMENVMQCKEEGAFWLGYPGWNGAEIEMSIPDGFVMNSASENKEGAWDFLEFLLSEELQNSIDWGFPVRRDSFEDYLSYSYIKEEDNSEEFNYCWNQGRQPAQEDFDLVWEMLDRAVYRSSGAYFNDNPARVILEEEVGMYFAGDATLDETVKKIQNRVGLYLSEL